MKKLKILIVDDSAYMRKKISEIFLDDPNFEGIRTAVDGKDALKKIAEEKPDVVSLDLVMPDMDGIETLDYIMSDFPTPVVIVSAHTKSHNDNVFEALAHGAVDIVTKPSGEISLDMDIVKEELRNKVFQASLVNIEKFIPKREVPMSVSRPESKPGKTIEKKFKKLVVIAASTGGPPALEIVLSGLPADLDACVLVIQHMPAGFTNSFASRLSRTCKLRVSEATSKEELALGKVFVAPGGFHMEVVGKERENNLKGILDLTKKPAVWGIRPAADLTMKTAVDVYGKNIIGVVLTGMGHDGAEGIAKIKTKGGLTIAQDEETCAVYGMSKTVIDEGLADKVLPIGDIADEIVRMVDDGK